MDAYLEFFFFNLYFGSLYLEILGPSLRVQASIVIKLIKF